MWLLRRWPSNRQSQELFETENKISGIYVIMERIGQGLSSLFRFNSRSHCGLSLLKKELEDIYRKLVEIRNLFDENKKIHELTSAELALLMLFFFRCIFNLSFKTKPILSRLDVIYRRSNMKELTQQSFDFAVCGEHGCVIQSTLESNSFGLINRITARGPVLFGYCSVESMIKLNVNELLPRCTRN